MITTVTLNLSLDRAYEIKNTVKPGRVMRVETCIPSAGGKGINVARIIKLCGEDVLATGLAGGHIGALVEDLLDQQGIPHDFSYTSHETRCCINVLAEDGSSTEFLEPGEMLDDTEIAMYLKKYTRLAATSDLVVMSGSAAPGTGVDIYARLIDIAADYSVPVILDTSGDYLLYGLKAHPFLIKPNQEELEALLKAKINNDDEIIAAARTLQSMGAKNVLVSLGKRGAILVTTEGIFSGKPPVIEAVNTVGSGDSMIGAFAVSLIRGKAMAMCLSDAIAISAANAMNVKTGVFDPEDLRRIVGQVVVEQIG